MNERQRICAHWRRSIAALVVLTIQCGGPRTGRAHDEHDNLPSTGVAVDGDRLRISPEAEKSLGLSTAVVHLKTMERDVMANASVEVPWRQHAFATSLLAGRIAHVLVRPGDTVEKGQELAQVESAEIEALQTDLLKAAAELELANHLVEQRTSLAEGGSIPDRRLLEGQTARDGWAASRGIVIRKLLSLGMTSAALDDVLKTRKLVRTISITSPLRGVVSVANVRSGQVVEPWQQVYEIVDMSNVWVHGQVLETDCTEVAEGQAVEIRVDAVPDRTFMGIVDHVGVKLDPEFRSLHVHVEVDNPQKLLREGMFARMRIRARVVPEAIACPLEAIIDPGGEPSVLVLDRAGVYMRQRVKLGLRSGGFVEILDGLFPGDPVIVVGKQELASLFAGGNATSASQTAGASTARSGSAGPSRRSTPARRVIVQGQVELPTSKKAAAYTTVTGRIASILVEHGERVRAGQVLAEVESLELRNVQLDLLQAQTRLKLAATLLERYGRLIETGAVAQKDYWQAQTDTEKLHATVEGLKSKLSMLGLSEDEIAQMESIDVADSAATAKLRTTFEARAPIDGRITVFDLSIGQVVRPQDALFEIHDLSRVVVRGYVYEQDAADIRVGEPAVVTITADPTFSAVGIVDRTAPTLSTFGRAMSVWVDLDNRDGKLKEGMLARLAINPRPADKQTAADAGSGDTAVPADVDPEEGRAARGAAPLTQKSAGAEERP